MPRQLALLICVCFIVWLFRTDMQQRRAGSWALLIPGLWLAIIGSRPLGYWLGTPGGPDATNVEGHPINVLVQGALILAACVVLQRRAFGWAAFVSRNKALLLIYLYYAASAVWSYYSAPSLKRVFKDFGCVLMVLILLTEPDPFLATRIVFVRCAYLLLPLSVLLIKYYPELGRMYSKSWELMYTGVTTHKNTLGLVVLVFGLMIVLDLLELRREPLSRAQKTARLVRGGMILMALWLLDMSSSKTSLLCVVLGAFVLWGSGRLNKMKSPGRALAAGVAVVLCLALLEAAFGISRAALEALGRDQTLTGRTEIWQMVKEQRINPMFGYGFMSFWDTPMARAYNEEGGTAICTVHNGYLEAYVDGGVLAVLLLALILLVGGAMVYKDLLSNTLFGRTKCMFFTIALIYNWSESSFFRLDPLWFVLLLALIRCPPCYESYGAVNANPGASPSSHRAGEAVSAGVSFRRASIWLGPGNGAGRHLV